MVRVTQNIALHCELVAVAGRKLSFVLDENNASLFRERQVAALELAFQQVLEQSVEVEVVPGRVGSKTPQELRMRRLEERQRAAEEALQHDQLLAQFLGEYDATVVEGSIRASAQFRRIAMMARNVAQVYWRASRPICSIRAVLAG